MSTERTPLTSQIPPGPAYVFPGVSPRTRRRQVKQFQCCICFLFMTVLVLALIITISYTINENDKNSTESITTFEETLPPPIDPGLINITNLLNYMLAIEQPIGDEPISPWMLPEPPKKEKDDAEYYGIKALGDREIMEENLISPAINTPSFRHQRAISTTPEARKMSKRGYVEYHATMHIAQKYNYTKTKGRANIGRGPKIGLPNPKENVTCDFNARYRTSNGTCNNRDHPRKYGAAMNPFRRALAPDYADGISSPRRSHSKHDLPSARQISLQVHRESYTADPHFTVMLAVWGQFLDHDITATAASQGPDGETIECCIDRDKRHPECFPVPLGPGDPYFDDYNVTCMNFVRSAPAPTGHFGPREQLNQATSFIDGSVVYGTSNEKLSLLRSNNNGQLRMFSTPDNRTLLPISTDPNDGCNESEMNAQGKYCFESGDTRANENLHLTSMHLLWARHHNYLAENLHNTNPEWDDETIFQEARKILGAQMQHVTYNEFIPVLLGSEFAKVKNLLPNVSNMTDMYDPKIDPSIGNQFAASAFRFAHTLIPGLMRFANANNNTPDSIQLHKMLFNPYSLWNAGGIDNALESAVNTPLSKSDQFFTTELTEKLFQGSPIEGKKQKLCGLDLVSLNIQRGRDHGLPAYYEWRNHCKLPPADTWERMSKTVDANSLENMKKIYSDPKDVDLYTGSLSEPPLENAIFGPLLACLVSDQFMRLKFGDSHWYERRRGPQRFTKEQIDEISKTTLAGVLCQNSDGVDETQKYVMENSNNSTNPIVSCMEIKEFNFDPWSIKNQENRIKSKVRANTMESFVSVIPKISNSSVVENILN